MSAHTALRASPIPTDLPLNKRSGLEQTHRVAGVFAPHRSAPSRLWRIYFPTPFRAAAKRGPRCACAGTIFFFFFPAVRLEAALCPRPVCSNDPCLHEQVKRILQKELDTPPEAQAAPLPSGHPHDYTFSRSRGVVRHSIGALSCELSSQLPRPTQEPASVGHARYAGESAHKQAIAYQWSYVEFPFAPASKDEVEQTRSETLALHCDRVRRPRARRWLPSPSRFNPVINRHQILPLPPSTTLLAPQCLSLLALCLVKTHLAQVWEQNVGSVRL